MKRCVVLGAGLILMGLGAPVWGASQATDNEAYSLDEMVVTATRYDESVNSIPANVSTITAKDISNSTATNVADLLRTAGAHVSDITGNRRTYSVDLRGFGETAAANTLVLVDGRRTNQADLSGVDWTQIPLDRVERVEIIRGGRASTLYGDNAAAGVINIISKKGGDTQLGASAQAGSYDFYKGSAYARGNQDSFSYSFSGSYSDIDGYRDNSENEVKDFGADLGYDANDNLFLKLSSGYHKDTAGLPGAIKESDFRAGADREDTLHPDDYADYEDYYVLAGPEYRFLSDSLVKMDVSYRKRDTSSYSSYAAGWFDGTTEINTTTVTPQFVVKEALFDRDNTLITGLDFTDAREDITNSSEYFGWYSRGGFDLEKKNVGAYLHDEMTILPKLSLSGGYRYDTAEYDFESTSGPVTPDNIDFDEQLYTAGLNYAFGEGSNVYANFARSYRYPLMDELFNFFTNTIDTSLSPQTSVDYEAGVRYAISDVTSVKLNLFHVVTEDEIFYNPDLYSNMNMDGDTIRDGMEMSADRRFGWGALGVHYTLTASEIDGGDYDGEEVPDVPAHQAGFDAVVSVWKPITFALTGSYVGERPFISDWHNTFGDQDDYFVMNAKVKYQWKMAAFFLDINNLLNEEYSEYGALGGFPLEKAYYPSPKTNFLLGVSFEM